MSYREAGKHLGVSHVYVWEIAKDKKRGSDDLRRQISAWMKEAA